MLLALLALSVLLLVGQHLLWRMCMVGEWRTSRDVVHAGMAWDWLLLLLLLGEQHVELLRAKGCPVWTMMDHAGHGLVATSGCILLSRV